VRNSGRRDVPATTQRSFWQKRWENIEPVVGALVEDALVMIFFIVVLTAVYLALGLLAQLGYAPQRIEMFETIHYYAYLAVFVLFMIDLVLRILLHTVRKR
jgi:hypothetical protein